VFLEQGMLARNLCEFNIFHIINENFNLFSCVVRVVHIASGVFYQKSWNFGIVKTLNLQTLSM